jgi:HK97 family phage prohead protease
METMEKRIHEGGLEIRKEGDKRFIEGAGIMFGVESKDLGGFREIIDPKALEGADMTDIIIRAEHDNNYVLGRTSSGTAQVNISGTSANYSAEIPNTTAGRDMAEYIQRGDLRGSSFAFSGVKDNWEERKDGQVIRTITKIARIHDMGPVFNPAYGQTDFKVALRGLEEWREEKKKEEKPPVKVEEKKPAEVKAPAGLSVSEKLKLID